MKGDTKRLWTAVSVMVGTSIGAGVLGIPYVAAQAGFFVALSYIILLGGIMLLANLYLGEIALRTKGHHQLPGYAQKYLGRKGFLIMEFALVFGIYSAVMAYMLGVGESISFLVYGDASYSLFFGVLFGIGMSGLIWKGVKGLKKIEKFGVGVVLSLLVLIFIMFFNQIDYANLYFTNLGQIFVPFGVILFSLLSFSAIPEIEIILNKKEKLMKKTILISTLISVSFYIVFAFVVVGVKGVATPEIATLALGPIFVFLGIFTMFTSYLALGNALQDNFLYDERFKKTKSWILTAIVPIAILVLIQTYELFSFTKFLSIGGTISGGLTAVLILLMVNRAKREGKRKPEYKITYSKFLGFVLRLVFIFGMLLELGVV